MSSDPGFLNAKSRNQLWIADTSGNRSYYMDLHLTISESHTLASDITMHRVETGSDITDAVQSKPDKVSFECFISNQPLADIRLAKTNIPLSLPTIPGPDFPTPGAVFGAVGGAIRSLLSTPPNYTAVVNTASEEFNNVEDALVKLRSLKENGTVVVVYTKDATYPSMILDNVGFSRDKDDGDGAMFRLSFTQVRIVDTKTTKAPSPTQARAGAPQSKGTQPATEVAPGDKESLLHLGRAKLQSLFGGGA